MSSPLQDFNILVADSDRQLSGVLKEMLAKMGFSNTQTVHSGDEVLEKLHEAPVDFLITEWDTEGLDGMEVIHRIRRNPKSSSAVLPIMMLTGRAEVSDVMAARDQGINEYIVKSFSAQSMYDRLERLIEKPRPFVVANTFIGPDRRSRSVPPENGKDRRGAPVVARKRQDDSGVIKHDGNAARMWLPDFSLKEKLGTDVSLLSLITPTVLNLAQTTIEYGTQESLRWIKENLMELLWLNKVMANGEYSDTLATDLAGVALVVSSRAGTFGYASASEVAYMLYLFCRNSLRLHEAVHRTIVEKHIEVLYVILSDVSPQKFGSEDAEIIFELRNLVSKYAA